MGPDEERAAEERTGAPRAVSGTPEAMGPGDEATRRSVPRQVAMWEATGVTVTNAATLWDVRKLRAKRNLPIKRFTGLVRMKGCKSNKKGTKQLLFCTYMILSTREFSEDVSVCRHTNKRMKEIHDSGYDMQLTNHQNKFLPYSYPTVV